MINIVGLFGLSISIFIAHVCTHEVNERLICHPGITRFSTGASPTHYYECTGSKDGKARLVQCPEGLFYQTKTQTCVPRDQYAKPEAFDTQALGRNLQLGSFYDARTNMFFPESSFWTREKINDNANQKNGGNTKVKYLSDQRTLDKTDHMDIHAELEMDFMSGMVHVAGSADYFDDKVSSEYEVNVELTYEATKATQSITKYLEKDFGWECENPQYTHIVTEVTLGISAFFVFKSLATDKSEANHVRGDLEISINEIPSFSASGGGQVDLSESQQETLNSTNLRMFGDFSPEHPLPSTFDSAVDFYRLLPTMTTHHENDTWSGVTITSVHLLPITSICDDIDRVLNEIADQTMMEVTSMLDKLEQLNMEVGALLGSSPSQKFKPLRQNLKLYRTALKQFEIQNKRNLAEILPNVRGGNGMGESDLLELVTKYTLSQFRYETSHAFLVNRGREINSIKYFVEIFTEESNIGLADYENANDVEYIFERDMVVVLDVNILTPASLTEDFLNGTVANEDGFWFNDVSNIGSLGNKLKIYHEFALDNLDQDDRGYLLKISPYSETQQYSMTAYYKGQLVTGSDGSHSFDVPKPPSNTPVASQITHNGFTFNIKKLNAFTIGVRVFITNIIEDKVREQDILFPADAMVNEDIEIEINKLELYKEYSFYVKYLTEVGTSPPSQVSPKFNTAPLSHPTRVSAGNVGTDSLTLSWGVPTTYAPGIDTSLIEYEIVKTDIASGSQVVTTGDLQYQFTGLSDATAYSFEVSAVYTGGSLENRKSSPENIFVVSSPLPPTMIEPTEVFDHSAIITWDPPARLGTGAELVHYVVEYSGVGEEHVKSVVVQENKCELTDLAMDTVYSFRAKIVTTLGKSQYSSQMPLTTTFTQTEMGQFKDEVYGAISDLVKEIRRETRICASKAESTDTGTLTYDSIYSDLNNVDGAKLDTGTGLFTAGMAGVYQVSYNMELVSKPGQEHTVWVIVNGAKVAESMVHSKVDFNEFEASTDNGGRVIMVNLDQWDTVGLTHQTDGEGNVKKINFCVSSVMLQ